MRTTIRGARAEQAAFVRRYHTDPAFRAEYDAHLRRGHQISEILTRYSVLFLGPAMESGQITFAQGFDLLQAARTKLQDAREREAQKYTR